MSETTEAPTLTDLADALTIVAGGELDDEGRQIALATYRLLAKGTPITNNQVAAAVNSTVDTVARRFDEWVGVFRNRDEAIVGFWGLAIDPLDPEYRLRAADSSDVGYAWCAWDTLFLPAVLGQTLEMTASDGHTGETIRLTVAPDGVRRSERLDAVVSFAVPDGAWEADVMNSFCHKVLFFANQHNADQWIATHPDELITLSVEDAFELGRLWTRARYGDDAPQQAQQPTASAGS